MNTCAKKILVLILGIVFLCSLFVILSHFQAMRNPTVSIDMVNDPLATNRYLIETEYPEFKDFENQKSFAGQSVKSAVLDFDYYFVFVVHGSGLPIVQATCFRVDRSGRVFKIGLFPDPLDSYAGYSDIDPVNCRGII